MTTKAATTAAERNAPGPACPAWCVWHDPPDGQNFAIHYSSALAAVASAPEEEPYVLHDEGRAATLVGLFDMELLPKDVLRLAKALIVVGLLALADEHPEIEPIEAFYLTEDVEALLAEDDGARR